MRDQTLLPMTWSILETSSNGVAVGFARPQSVVVRPPSSGSVHIVRGQRTSKRGGYCHCHRFCSSVALPTPFPSLSVSLTPPPPSGMVVYVLRPDRIVVCFRRREGRSKEEGLVCSAMLSAMLCSVGRCVHVLIPTLSSSLGLLRRKSSILVCLPPFDTVPSSL